MIYWQLPDPNGSYETVNGERCNLFSTDDATFPPDFRNYCQADILKEALERLQLTLTPTTQKRYSQFALKEELTRRNLWQNIKAAMTADEYESFILADYLAADHPLFTDFLARLQVPDLADILEACEI